MDDVTRPKPDNTPRTTIPVFQSDSLESGTRSAHPRLGSLDNAGTRRPPATEHVEEVAVSAAPESPMVAEQPQTPEVVPGPPVMDVPVANDGSDPIPQVPESLAMSAVPGPSLASEVEKNNESAGQVSAAPTNQPKHRGGGAVIFVAVILALALVGGAGYAYLQNNKVKPKATVTTTPSTSKTTPTKTTPATASDVDKSSQSIDTSLKKVDDTTDNQASDLSDTTLGL